MNELNQNNFLLRVKNVQYTYPTVRNMAPISVLQGVNFDIPSKQFCTIVGKSGCGKTTLLKIIAGLLRPSTGVVQLNGKTVTAPSSSVAVVFQDYSKSLLPWCTVRENVRLGLINENNLDESIKDKRVDDYLEKVHLLQSRDKYPWQLSGGMQQRVAIARALARHPDLLLMDEPFGALDAFTRLQLEDEVRGLTKKLGFTTLMITHDIDEAVYMSDRVLIMTGNGNLDTYSTQNNGATYADSPQTNNNRIDIEIKFPEDEHRNENGRHQVVTRKHKEYQEKRADILRTLQPETLKTGWEYAT